MPTIVTNRKTVSDSARVTITWLVKVKNSGNTPSRLPKRMKKNRVNTNGKKAFPSSPIWSMHILRMPS